MSGDGESTNYTPDQIEEAITAAIGDHEFEAAVSMLKLLAIRSPHRAQEILDEINVGLRMARRSTNRGPS